MLSGNMRTLLFRLPVNSSSLLTSASNNSAITGFPKSLAKPTSPPPLISLLPAIRTFSSELDSWRVRSDYGEKRQVWLENLDTVKEEKLDILDLHPDVFAVYPRIDYIHDNVIWQNAYKKVDYTHIKNRYEMVSRYGGGKRPWPMKGTGRARQGSIRAPQWHNGGKAHGPRGPKPHFYMLDYHRRVYGLTHTLSAKFVQDDVHVVRNLDIPTDDSDYLLDLIKERNWARSVLFVDVDEVMPRNITAAADNIPQVNLMPVFGLNVVSMLRHQTLVLTEAALERITDKLLFALNRTDMIDKSISSKHGHKRADLKMEQYRPAMD